MCLADRQRKRLGIYLPWKLGFFKWVWLRASFPCRPKRKHPRRSSVQDPNRTPLTQEIHKLSHLDVSDLVPTTSCLLHRWRPKGGNLTVLSPHSSVPQKEWVVLLCDSYQSSGWLLYAVDEDTRPCFQLPHSTREQQALAGTTVTTKGSWKLSLR